MGKFAFHQGNLLVAEVLKEVKGVHSSVQEAILLFSDETTPVDNNLHDEVCLGDRDNFAGYFLVKKLHQLTIICMMRFARAIEIISQEIQPSKIAREITQEPQNFPRKHYVYKKYL